MSYKYKFDTKAQSQFIKDWLCANQDVIKFIGISKRSGVSIICISKLMQNKHLTISQGNINKIVPILKNYGFKMPDEFTKFEAIICEEVGKFTEHKLCVSELCSPSRKREIVLARNLSMIFRKKVLKHSLEDSCMPYNRNYATGIHALKSSKNLMETDRNFKIMVGVIEKRLGYSLF